MCVKQDLYAHTYQVSPITAQNATATRRSIESKPFQCKYLTHENTCVGDDLNVAGNFVEIALNSCSNINGRFSGIWSQNDLGLAAVTFNLFFIIASFALIAIRL